MQLADVYRVSVEDLLPGGEKLRDRAQPLAVADGKAAFHLDGLRHAPEKAGTLATFGGSLQGYRDDYSADVLAIRNADVTTLSAVYGLSTSEFW